MPLPEMIILMLTLFYEAGVCSEAEMTAVARVIQVRAEQRGTTPATECLRPYQFSCWNGVSGKHRILKEYMAGKCHASSNWAKARRVATALYAGKLDGMPRWTHYYNPKIASPMWRMTMIEKRRYPHHLFGRIEP